VSAPINFTDAKISGLKRPLKGQTEFSDAKVPGLRVRIGASGKPSFIVRKRIGGKIKVITLGTYSSRFGLADARKKARSVLSDLEAGKPVLAVTKRAQTISNLWPEYIATKATHRSAHEITRIFERYILPALGDRMADTVTRGDVTRFIDSIAAPVMARAVFAQLSAFYGWALPRLDALPANPCIGAGRPAKPKARDRVLNDNEIAALWRAADMESPPWQQAVKLLLLTGQRRSEVFEAEWSEFDLKEAVWTIPAERAKNNAAHIVPLSNEALAIIESIPKVDGSKFVFPAADNPANPCSGISKVVERLRKAIAKDLDRDVETWSLHDLRRTVATGLQRLGIRFEVTEAVLNHVSGSKAGVAGVYQRHDWKEEKRMALDAWGSELVGKVMGKKAINVVTLRA